MSFSLDTCVHAAVRGVSEAIRLDGNNRNKDAYIQYLGSMQYIIQCLLEDAKDVKQSHSASRKKFVQIGLQCMDRVAKLSDNLGDTNQIQSNTTLSKDNSSTLHQEPEPPPQCGRPAVGSRSLPAEQSQDRDGKAVHLPQRSTSVPAPLSKPPGKLADNQAAKRMPPTPKLSPMEIATRQNQALMEAYKSRVSKMNRGKNVNSTLSLTVQRKMAENIAMAKTRQDALNRKIHERHARLKEIADRRFTGTIGMSEDEQERRQIYTQILEYEHDKKWPLAWRSMVNNKPNDEVLIRQLIKHILGSDDHPLCLLIKKCQYSVYNKLKPIVSKYLERVRKLDTDVQEFEKSLASKNDRPPTISEQSETVEDIECSKGTEHEKVSVVEGTQEEAVNQEDESKSKKGDEQSGGKETSNDTGVSGGCDEENDAGNESDQNVSVSENEDFSAAFEGSKQEIEGAIKRGEKTLERLTSVDLIDEMDDLFAEEELSELLENEKKKETKEAAAAETEVLSDSETVVESKCETGVKSKCETEVDSKCERKACQQHLKDISKDVHIFLDKLIAMFIVAYESLDSPVARDQCHALLEEAFFKPIWPWLMILFRIVYEDEEQKLVSSIKTYYHVSPKQVGVLDKWCLGHDGDNYPYKTAIDELGKVVAMVCPLEKLECIVKVSRLVCECAEEFYASKEESAPALGADDLLPILCYVLLRSHIPQIVSECHAMEEFIHEGYLMGEEGYCLTSFQTALNYIITQLSNC